MTEETHFCFRKNLQILGMHEAIKRCVKLDRDGSMCLEDLKEKVRNDKKVTHEVVHL